MQPTRDSVGGSFLRSPRHPKQAKSPMFQADAGQKDPQREPPIDKRVELLSFLDSVKTRQLIAQSRATFSIQCIAAKSS